MDLRAMILVLTWLAVCNCQNSPCQDSEMFIYRTTVIRLYGDFDCWWMNQQKVAIERLQSEKYYYWIPIRRDEIAITSSSNKKTIRLLSKISYSSLKVSPIFHLNSCARLNIRCDSSLDHWCDDYIDYIDVFVPNSFAKNDPCGAEIRKFSVQSSISKGTKTEKPKKPTISPTRNITIQDTKTTDSQGTTLVFLGILVALLILAIIAIAICFMHQKFDSSRANRIVPLSDFVLESNFASIEENDQLQETDQNQELPKYEEIFSEHQEPPSYEEANKDNIEIGDNIA